jgi:hypothetical protein
MAARSRQFPRRSSPRLFLRHPPLLSSANGARVNPRVEPTGRAKAGRTGQAEGRRSRGPRACAAEAPRVEPRVTSPLASDGRRDVAPRVDTPPVPGGSSTRGIVPRTYGSLWLLAAVFPALRAPVLGTLLRTVLDGPHLLPAVRIPSAVLDRAQHLRRVSVADTYPTPDAYSVRTSTGVVLLAASSWRSNRLTRRSTWTRLCWCRRGLRRLAPAADTARRHAPARNRGAGPGAVGVRRRRAAGSGDSVSWGSPAVLILKARARSLKSEV